MFAEVVMGSVQFAVVIVEEGMCEKVCVCVSCSSLSMCSAEALRFSARVSVGGMGKVVGMWCRSQVRVASKVSLTQRPGSGGVVVARVGSRVPGEELVVVPFPRSLIVCDSRARKMIRCCGCGDHNWYLCSLRRRGRRRGCGACQFV